MKTVLLTSRSIKKNDEIYFSLDKNWFNYLLNTKITLIPNLSSKMNDYLEEPSYSGIVLAGGGNIRKNSLSNNDFDDERELVEEHLIEYSLANNIPLIGVCRGMQKIMTVLEKKIEFVHNKIDIKDPYELSNAIKSEVTFKGTRTCYNNFSILYDKNIENSWNVLCLDSNRNILAVIHKKYKILSFMWHPERDMSDFELINSFLN